MDSLFRTRLNGLLIFVVSFTDDPIGVLTVLKTKLSKVNNPLATNAKKSLNGLSKRWSNLSSRERAGIQGTLSVITSSFDKFINAGDDPVGAIRGAINIIASIASNFGPKGQLVSMGLGFVSSILGLFGKGPNQPPMRKIVREIVNEALSKYHDRVLTDRAHGVINALSYSISYMDGVAQAGKPLNLEQMKLVSSRVPIIHGSAFMGELFTVTNRLFTKNQRNDARKAIKYTELYVKTETLRDMILTQLISLASNDENQQFDVQGLIHLRSTVRRGVKVLLGNLYPINAIDSNKSPQILPYYDPDNSPVTDAYARTFLSLGKNYGLISGEYCLVDRNNMDLDWQRVYSRFKVNGKPYLVPNSRSNRNCFWKLVPHGNNIYSIVNKYRCKDNYEYCNAMLSWDGYGTQAYATIDYSDPILWEIKGKNYVR